MGKENDEYEADQEDNGRTRKRVDKRKKPHSRNNISDNAYVDKKAEVIAID